MRCMVWYGTAAQAKTDEVLAVYNAEPHVVLSVNVETGVCNEVGRTSSPQLFRHLRGSMHLGGNS
jgi:hypothetical protein